jgi:hypothetical protein
VSPADRAVDPLRDVCNGLKGLPLQGARGLGWRRRRRARRDGTALAPPGGNMIDLIFFVATALFFVLAWGYASTSERV